MAKKYTGAFSVRSNSTSSKRFIHRARELAGILDTVLTGPSITRTDPNGVTYYIQRCANYFKCLITVPEDLQEKEQIAPVAICLTWLDNDTYLWYDRVSKLFTEFTILSPFKGALKTLGAQALVLCPNPTVNTQYEINPDTLLAEDSKKTWEDKPGIVNPITLSTRKFEDVGVPYAGRTGSTFAAWN